MDFITRYGSPTTRELEFCFRELEKKIDYICNKYELEGANMEETTKMH